MKKYRYILDKSSKKFVCRACGKKRFVRYIDTETGEYLPEQYGRCDRESKCSYHFNPYKDGYSNRKREQKHIQCTNKLKLQPIKPLRKTHISFIPHEVLNLTFQGYEKNIFIQNLLTHVAYPFNVEDIEKVISLYQLGTVQRGYRTGAITFPYIDRKNNIRTIQVKQFDKNNHTTSTDFLHSIIEKHHTRNNKPLPEWLKAYKKNEIKVSCLFGEHLLNEYHQNPVALVEAPKTAVYGTLYFGFPELSTDFIWLAVYNKSSFSFNKLKVLQGRDVFVFPDLSENSNTFKEWEQEAKDYEKQLPGTKFIFSDLLERLSPETDKKKGNDLADFLIKQNWQQFRNRNKQQPTKPMASVSQIKPLINDFYHELPNIEYFESIKELDNWNNDISELEIYFKTINLPTNSIRLNAYTIITEPKLFINSHLLIVKAYNGNRIFLPYLNRLKKFKHLIDKKNDRVDSTLAYNSQLSLLNQNGK